MDDFYRTAYHVRMKVSGNRARRTVLPTSENHNAPDCKKDIQPEASPPQFAVNSDKIASAVKMAAGFAHRMKNHLTSIKLRLYSLKRIELPPDRKDDLEVIIDEIENIEGLVMDFLKLSPSVPLKTVKISPSEVLDKVVHLLEPELDHRRIKIRRQRTCLLSKVWLDAEQFSEALINIVINSSEAVKNGHGCISILEKEANQEPFGRSAVIEIRDNGDGIPEHVRDKIFEPFFSTKAEGCGLGLCLAKQFVEAQGGKISVSSKVNAGTVFTITLPC